VKSLRCLLVEDVGNERDKLRKDSRKWEGQVVGLTKEERFFANSSAI
jgi:hypothetical protein